MEILQALDGVLVDKMGATSNVDIVLKSECWVYSVIFRIQPLALFHVNFPPRLKTKV